MWLDFRKDNTPSLKDIFKKKKKKISEIQNEMYWVLSQATGTFNG